MPPPKKEEFDDEPVLPLEEQTNRPPDLALHQQRIQAWSPILDPVWVIVCLFYLGIIMVPVGFKIQDLSDNAVELRQTYDGMTPAEQLCDINTTYNAHRLCNITFDVTADMEPPILVHYELTNFHQNHKNYYKSFDAYQLLGRPSQDADDLSISFCEPLYKLGDMYINPCGLVPNTFFNDIITVQSGVDANNNPLVLDEEGIAWASDVEYKFAQPNGFQMQLCENPTPTTDSNGTLVCDAECCSQNNRVDGSQTNLPWSCDAAVVNPKDDNQCYRYHYPDEDINQYLYETYPDVISPLEGVTNEHFIVWMRIAALPTFRKLYGYFNQPLQAGSRIILQVESNYVVQSFSGSKSILLSTNNMMGGKNATLGTTFIGIGFFCLIAAILFTLKHWLRPRKLADRRYLHFKED